MAVKQFSCEGMGDWAEEGIYYTKNDAIFKFWHRSLSNTYTPRLAICAPNFDTKKEK